MSPSRRPGKALPFARKGVFQLTGKREFATTISAKKFFAKARFGFHSGRLFRFGWSVTVSPLAFIWIRCSGPNRADSDWCGGSVAALPICFKNKRNFAFLAQPNQELRRAEGPVSRAF
jgi:hypothetical protein